MIESVICAIDPGQKPGFCVVHAHAEGAPSFIYAGKDPRAFRDYVRFFADSGRRITAILETPVIYPKGSGAKPADPNKILRLALTAGALARFAFPEGVSVGCVEPTTWKGAIPKDMHHRRIRPIIAAGFFRNTDLVLAQWDKSNTDMRDAIALAIWRLDPAKYHPMLTFDLDALGT